MLVVIFDISVWRGGLVLKETKNKGRGTLMRLSENNLPKEQQVFICCDLFRRSELQPHSNNKYH